MANWYLAQGPGNVGFETAGEGFTIGAQIGGSSVGIIAACNGPIGDGVQGNGTGNFSGVAGWGGASSGTGVVGFGGLSPGGTLGGPGVRGIGGGGQNSNPFYSVSNLVIPVGVYGQGAEAADGVYGQVGPGGNATDSTAGVHGKGGQSITNDDLPSVYAGFFEGPVRIEGDLTVTGTITKVSGAFQIDHPLDPANKYLVHSFVESPEMKNIYDGVAVADASGEVVVELPAYFGALNKDLRYQLTAIGVPAPNLHVKEEARANRFAIGGAGPGQRICWQVTGSRNDAWAIANPMIVERDKRKVEKTRLQSAGAYAGLRQ
jgi:hypothetical protein